MTDEKIKELSAEEYLSLLNGKIEGLVMSVQFLASLIPDKQHLILTLAAFSNSAELINEKRRDGELDHMEDEYVNGTLYVLEKVEGYLSNLESEISNFESEIE